MWPVILRGLVPKPNYSYRAISKILWCQVMSQGWGSLLWKYCWGRFVRSLTEIQNWVITFPKFSTFLQRLSIPEKSQIAANYFSMIADKLSQKRQKAYTDGIKFRKTITGVNWKFLKTLKNKLLIWLTKDIKTQWLNHQSNDHNRE